ncbi:MAG TPA: RluA family pseudouridine synthase [Bacteroidia bacterium]|nr:RluA family pseudouridine synthase [Bacteroidia bacterium]
MEDKLATNFEEEELYEHHSFKVDKGQSLVRIDKYLFNLLPNASRTKIQTACKANCVLVNGKPVAPNYKVKPLDEIKILLTRPPREFKLIPENIPLDILYEDDYILVINKPAGMVVHPGAGNFTGTLVNALLYHYENLPTQKQKLSEDFILDRPGLVHRIDKNTSGILVIAKTELALQILAKDFFDHNIERKYVALVWGKLKNEKGTISGFIGRDPSNRKIMKLFDDESKGKWSVTHYKVLQYFNYHTLVECTLETGRTHQIRVHFKSINHPLFNDEEYGGNKILYGVPSNKYKSFVENLFTLIPGQALHAAKLGFNHPISKKWMCFETPLPQGFQDILEKLKTFK